jgi:hypothetical protein
LAWAGPPLVTLAQDDRKDAEITQAIRRGVEYLKSQQQIAGNWSYQNHDVGITALTGLALAENGVPATDPQMKRAYQYVQANAPSTTQTYDISLAILFLVRMGEATDNDLIQQLGARLAAGQLPSGGWSYHCPLVVPANPAASVSNKPPAERAETPRRGGRLNAAKVMRGGAFGDNSNTQFAVLGVWAAGRAGLEVKDTMAAVEQRFRTTQSAQGGWGYSRPGSESDAMTCAGLMALVLAKGHKALGGQMINRRPDGEQPEGLGGRPKMESDPQIDAGIRRVEAYANNMHNNSTLYFLWSVERVGVALGVARIGRVDWYSRGATVLLQTQRANGSWDAGRGDLADTAFALLFLRRSNLTEGMPQLITSRSDDSGGNRMRSGGLEDLIRTVRPAGPKAATTPD